MFQSISAVEQHLDPLPGVGFSTSDAFPRCALCCHACVANTGSASLYLILILPDRRVTRVLLSPQEDAPDYIAELAFEWRLVITPSSDRWIAIVAMGDDVKAWVVAPLT
ncbi:hypothetical protein [Falsiroseomonas sp. E2-1-a20]|uniref:hypothetical protein n=1 Tax=Falsiroseomonas sp. E2-1-a20 TaxID=3239300 RepID=UPI003F2C9337